MVRPCKDRVISSEQKFTCFKPTEIPLEKLEKIELKSDELEAFRLADLEWLKMEEWSEKMWISPPTFCRLVKKARKKIADFLVNWKRLRVYK